MSRSVSRVRYKNVTSPEELLKIIALRHERLVKELGRIQHEQTHDPYDSIGYNLLAYTEDEPERIIGTIRMVDERDLKYLDNGRRRLEIKNFDLESHRGRRNLLVERLVTSQEKRENTKVLPGLFGCVYVYCYEKKITDLFIVANCQINPGKVEIPKMYLRLGFEPIAEIKKKYYDDFDSYSVPMHRITGDILGQNRRSAKRMKFENFRESIDFEYIPPEERRATYEEAIKRIPYAG